MRGAKFLQINLKFLCTKRLAKHSSEELAQTGTGQMFFARSTMFILILRVGGRIGAVEHNIDKKLPKFHDRPSDPDPLDKFI
jgi:hypothetical protein